MIPFLKTAAAFVLFTVSAVHAQSPDDQYVPGPDSKPQAGVPKGTVTKHTWDKSKVLRGTTRDYWVYVPAQYKKGNEAAVFVCQDGVMYEAPTVFDNLIHKKEMPVTIGIFIQPGSFPGKDGEKPRSIRSAYLKAEIKFDFTIAAIPIKFELEDTRVHPNAILVTVS